MRIFEEGDPERSRFENSELRLLRLLLDDDWRPLSEYVYDRRYVYAATVNHLLRSNVLIARGGKQESSYWWTPDNKEVPVMSLAGLSVTHWKPLPDHVDAYNPIPHWEELTGHKHRSEPCPRPPEPIYEPGPPTARLTPGPRDLLVAMRYGAVLRERGQRWSSWTLQRPGREPEKLTARPIDALRELAFIARDGVRPSDPTRWYEFDWHVTDAGRA